MRTPAALVALSLIAATTVVAAAPAEASTPKCFGKKATITVTKKNKTVKGTKKNDVIIVTSSGDTIVGNGGTDRICATKVKSITTGSGADQVQLADGKVSTGAGNDEIVQKGVGKVTINAGAGTDTIQISNKVKTGSVVDGGADPDKVTVPAAQLPAVSIPVTSGDTLNGINDGIDQPAIGGPDFSLFADDQLVNGVPTVPAISPHVALTQNPLDDGEAFFQVTPVAYAVGRSPGSWSISFGDGTPPVTGNGSPPPYRSHDYLNPGTYTTALTVTDSLGALTTRSVAVVATLTAHPYPAFGLATVSGTTVTFPVTVNPATNAYPVTSWIIDFGDGTEQSGPGAPPSSIAHTYPAAASYRVALETQDSTGDVENTVVGESFGATPNLALSFARQDRVGASALHLTPGAELEVFEQGSQGFDSYDLSTGDGTAPYTSSSSTSQYLTYAAPGTYTVKLTGHRSGQPDVSITRTVTVSLPPSTLALSVPGTVPEGPTAISFAGSTIAPGAIWSYQDSSLQGFATVHGTGPLPAMTHTFAAESHIQFWNSLQANMITASVSSPPVPLNDVSTLVYSIGVFKQVNVVPLGTRLGPIGYLGNDIFGSYFGGAYTGAFDIDLSPYSPIGVRLTTATATVDGQALKDTIAPLAQSPTAFLHPMAVGDHPITISATDTAKRTSMTYGFVSIAGVPVLTAPTSVTGTNASTTISGLSTSTPNAKVLAWSVSYDAGNDVTAYGPLPASLTTSFPSGTSHSATIRVFDDHGQEAEQTVSITTS